MLSIVGGADAVRAIHGHLVSARKPPILPNAFRNSVPLYPFTHSRHVHYRYLQASMHVSYHSVIQWASSTATRDNLD